MTTQNRTRVSQASRSGRKKLAPQGAKKDADRSPREKKRISTRQTKARTPTHPRWSIPLHNLVRLDWANRSPLPKQELAAADDYRAWLAGQKYEVETLVPAASPNAPLYLSPARDYFVVPILEQGQPQRYLLVREQDQFDEHWPYIVVSEPSRDNFAHLHILGGHTDKLYIIGGEGAEIPVESPKIIAVAEAILSPISAQILGGSMEQTGSVEASSAPVDAPLDEELLASIDALTIAQGARPNTAEEFGAVHRKFLAYLQKNRGLEIIPIDVGQTLFDAAKGHYAVDTVHNAEFPDQVIVRVLRDGYLRGGKTVREAYVVVNSNDSDTSATTQPMTAAPTKPQPEDVPSAQPDATLIESDKVDEGLLSCIDILTLAQSAQPERGKDLEDAHTKFLAYVHQNYGLKIIPIVPNKTLFNPFLGHYAIDTTRDYKWPDGVIVGIVRDGYTCDDKVVREAHVIVNRRSIAPVQAGLSEIEIIHPGHYLRVKTQVQSLTDLSYFFEESLINLRTIDLIYSVLVILQSRSAELATRFAHFLKEQIPPTNIPLDAVHNYLKEAALEPLRLVRLQSGSPIDAVLKGDKDLLRQVQLLIIERQKQDLAKTEDAAAGFKTNLDSTIEPSLPSDIRDIFLQSIQAQLSLMTFTSEPISTSSTKRRSSQKRTG
jgi:molecular chaperone GrpE (heat shock protein)